MGVLNGERMGRVTMGVRAMILIDTRFEAKDVNLGDT